MNNLNTIQQEIQYLPEEAQSLLLDLIQILKKLYPRLKEHEVLSLEDQPFVGMWSDRSETQDSSQWVRNIRRQHWRS
jgi:hypothetical protein